MDSPRPSAIQPPGIDRRPRVLARGTWTAANFFTASQDIGKGITWTIQRDMDTVIVHLGGPIRSLKTELEGCGSVSDPPMPGEIWIVPAGQRYSSEAQGGLVHYAELHFDAGVISRAAGKQIALAPAPPKAGHFDAFLHRGVMRLESLAQQPGDLSALTAESLSHALLLDFYQRYCANGADPAPLRHIRFSARERAAVESLIQSSLGGRLKLNSLASHVRMTTHEFLIAFRAAFHTTPAQYIIEQRLRRVRWLLLTTANTVAYIAFETGFSSHAHLTTVFRKRLGVTPQAFRTAYRGRVGML